MDWKSEFDKKYPPTPSSPQFLQFREELKSFIENLLEQEKKRMSDEVEKMKPERDDTMSFRLGFNVIGGKALSIINKK